VTRTVRIGLFLPALAGFAALLVWALTGLPDFGNYIGPYGYLLNHVVLPERHMTNVVTAVVFDYRGFDTMGEEFILFASVTGVVLLLRKEGRGVEDAPDDSTGSDLVRVVGSLCVGVAILVGLWLIAFGFVTPGGGFQGGVIVASGGVLLYLVADYKAWKTLGSNERLDPLEGLGVGGYVVVGLAALISGMPFLTNLLGPGVPGTLWSGGSAPFVNWSAAIEVAAALLILFAEFLDEYIVPLAGGSTT
jgi:multicomponent Na+:H+ antiporter subunit B